MKGHERGQRLAAEAGLDGWLIADFRRNNPVLMRLLDARGGVLTRRCFLWLPAQGSPAVLASQVDGHTFAHLSLPVTLYRGFEDMREALRSLLPRGARVAMEYVPLGALPTVSRIDGGLLEMIRSLEVEVVSSASLIAGFEVWDERQQDLHRQAAAGVDEARRLALEHCFQALNRGETPTEGELVRRILQLFDQRGLDAPDGPDVAVGPHAADPHYGTGTGEGAPIPENELLLIDLWAKVRGIEDAPYADSTWMAYTGSTPPTDYVRAFEVARRSRDAAVEAIERALSQDRQITGREVDEAGRAPIIEAGMESYIAHRTGHSLGTDHVQGMGTNLDAVEFPDDRVVLAGSGFTIEPGLYLPGRFGVRLEISCVLTPTTLEITTERQHSLTLRGDRGG